jgi:hypothetical protein
MFRKQKEQAEIEYQNILAEEGLIEAVGVFDDLFAPQLNDAYLTHNFKDLSDTHEECSVYIQQLQQTLTIPGDHLSLEEKLELHRPLLDSVMPPEISPKEAYKLLNDETAYAQAKGCNKLNALKVMLYETCGELGIEPPKLYGSLIPLAAEASCFSSNNSLLIDLNIPSSQAVFFLKHEAFHVHQITAIKGNLHKNATYPTKEKIEAWQQPYIEHTVNFAKFAKQPLESDATEFAFKDMIDKKYTITDILHQIAANWFFTIKDGKVIRQEESKTPYNHATTPSIDLEKEEKNALIKEVEANLNKDPVTKRYWLEKIKRERIEQGRQLEPITNLAEEILNRIDIKRKGKSITHSPPPRGHLK